MKLQVPFVQLPLLFDADALAREVLALGSDAWREHPQKYPGNFALPLIAVDGDPDSDAVAGAMRPTSYLERCPYLMQVLGRLGAVWGRTRLMKLSGQAEVTPHADVNYYWRERVRVHVPILTRPTVRFLCGDAEVNMRPGECWIFDTWRQHRVINAADDERVHLVADTVGSVEFWDLVSRGRVPGHATQDWQPVTLPARSESRPGLRYESCNVPEVMTPWEMREHLGFLLRDVEPDARLPQVHQVVHRFQTRWQSLWSEYGCDAGGWPAYRAALDEFDEAIGECAGDLQIVNGTVFVRVLRAMVLSVALSDRGLATGDEARPAA
jgi:hypothetical protein